MVQTLFSGVSFVGVESKHFGKHVQSQWVGFRKECLEVLFRPFRQRFEEFKCLFVGDETDVLVTLSAEHTDDSLDLIEVVFAWENGGSAQQFCEDAADGPDVNRLRVLGSVQNDFGSTVPSSDNVPNHHTLF